MRLCPCWNRRRRRPRLGSLKGRPRGSPTSAGPPAARQFEALLPCHFLRRLEDAWQCHRDRGLVVLGVNLDQSETDALAFVRRHGLTYPNVRDSGTVAGAFGLAGLPETHFLGEDWAVSSVYRGFALEVDERRGRMLQDAIYPPIPERRIAALVASRHAPPPRG